MVNLTTIVLITINNQNALELLLGKLQNNVSQYEKEIQTSQDALLEKIKNKMDFLQNEQRKTLSGIAGVDAQLKRVESRVYETWNVAKKRLLLGGVILLILAFFAGLAGSAIYRTISAPDATVQASPTLMPTRTITLTSTVTPEPTLTQTLEPGVTTTSDPTVQISTSQP